MKKLFISMVAMIVAATSYAQNTLVATLSHGTDISMFYGSYALKEAMNAAASGDIINLSGGAFQAVNISKAVTLRGTGIDNASPTYIVNDFQIEIPDTETGRLSMEGIRIANIMFFSSNISNPYFLKCQFNDVSYFYSDLANVKDAMFADCKITGRYDLNGASTVQFINSYIYAFNNGNSEKAGASFINCVLSEGYLYNFYSSQLINCILVSLYNDNSSTFPSSSVGTNCVSIGFNYPFNDSLASTNNSTSTYEELFKNYTGTYSDDQTFELTDAAKTKFLGTDGTQVGMYGGVLPYTSTPSYPQISKMKASNKTTADGKLSVEIEVNAAQ